MKSILFYWGKGSKIRVKIIKETGKLNKQKKPCFLNLIAKKLGLSHVAVKRHVDILIEHNYLEPLNPDGKPVFLGLTEKGWQIFSEFSKK